MNVEEILTEFSVKHKKKPEYFVVLCPFHSDKDPSGNIHQKSGFFTCFACGKKATLVSYLTRYSNLPVYQIKSKIGYRSDCKNPIDATEVESYHIAIWQQPTFLNELHHRCITDEIIRRRKLGVKDNGMEKRVSIPIPNDIGEYANLRLYIPGAKSNKFINLTGKDRSKTRLYPMDQLEFDQILICGGELKALAAAEVLNKYDIGAIAPTCGENSWPAELNDRFDGKLLYINCDVDKIGERYAELRCRTLATVAREIHKVVLTSEMVGGLEKGDLNDFLRLGGDLYKLLLDTPEWVYVPGGELIDEPATTVEFRDAYSHENVGKKVSFTAIVAGINSSSYLPPATVEVRCNRNEAFCQLCDVNSQALTNRDATLNGTEMKIGKEHPALLALVNEETESHYRIYKTCFKIPILCRQCVFEPKTHYNLTEVMLDEQVDPTSRQEPLTMQTAYIVNSSNSVDQQTYNLTGRLYPSPKTQMTTFLISDLEPTADALDSYTPIDSSYLEMFRPREWTVEAIEEKLEDIYSDLEANVIRIYQRRDYYLAIDLAYHSVLNFKFGAMETNGYVEALIIGDTGQGKSETVKLMRKHYGLGYSIDCKNITLAGLTIGLEPGRLKRFAVYGALPKNDKRLVILEELIGMHPKTFQALTEVRSSGNVQITKINHKIRRARVRIIAISNPPTGREVASYTYGIEAAIGVINTHQDLRRFDIVMIIAKADIDQTLLSQTLQNPPIYPHKYSEELCQKLVLKAWKCEEVIFEDPVYILEATKRLVHKFGDGPPILDPNTSHIKLAKLSAALAARTCSYNGDTLIVRRCHTQYIEKYLDRIYSSPSCRLDEKSKSVHDSTCLRDREGLVSYLKSINSSADVMLKLAETDEISCRYVQELSGDFHTGATLMAKLIQSNAIIKIRADRYTKTPDFTKLLAEVQWEIKKPDYIKREKF